MYDEQSGILNIYCFCGLSKKKLKLKSIEKYDNKSTKWTKIDKEDTIVVNFNITALLYKNDIVVFGGHRIGDGEVRTMYRFEKSGRVKSRLCENEFIPIE